MNEEPILDKLFFAERRLDELLSLNGGDLPGANQRDRQQIFQEFFFHLVGAVDLLAQLVNEVKGLGLDTESVDFPKMVKQLPEGDQLTQVLMTLNHFPQRGKRLPDDLDNDAGYVLRMRNYRNHVTHRRPHPFYFTLPARTTHLWLDPRWPADLPSLKDAPQELRYMYKLVSNKCKEALDLVQAAPPEESHIR